MKISTKKGTVFGMLLFVCLPLFSISLLLIERQIFAQHSGGAMIDPHRQPGESPNSYHQSFAPYSGTVPIPWIDEKPEAVSIKVVDIITYEIPVDKKKLEEKKITIEDLEQKVVKSSNEINFHQVDCYYFEVIKQTQIRKTDELSYQRKRDGTQYWLSDGKKYIEWGKWSNWKRIKEEQGIEMAEKQH